MEEKRKSIQHEMRRVREQYLEMLRGLGIESLSPAEERERLDRLEDALAQVFLFAAQLNAAAVLDVYSDWQRMIDIYPTDAGGEE